MKGSRRSAIARPGDLEDVAGAVVEDGADRAQHRAAGVDDLETDQVGVVELVVGQRRQPVARGVEAGAPERLGLLAGGDAGEARGEGAGDRMKEAHAEAAAVLGDERRIDGDRGGVGAEGLQPHLAADAEAAGDGADAGEARSAIGRPRACRLDQAKSSGGTAKRPRRKAMPQWLPRRA